MDATVFAAMLASAVLHAAWNAWVKSSDDPVGALAALVIGAGWPSALLLVFAGPPTAAAWVWIPITVVLSVPAQALLGSAYREGDFAVAYPVVRGLNPVALALAAVPLFGEHLAPRNLLGIACVSTGIALIGWEAARRSRSMSLRGLAFAALAALITAAGALSDAMGARAAAAPFAYAPTIALGNALAMWIFTAQREPVVSLLRRHARLVALGPVISTISYLVAIWCMMRAPVALVIALRETSMFFAVGIAAVFLRERISAWRWAAVAVVFAGILLIRAS